MIITIPTWLVCLIGAYFVIKIFKTFKNRYKAFKKVSKCICDITFKDGKTAHIDFDKSRKDVLKFTTEDVTENKKHEKKINKKCLNIQK